MDVDPDAADALLEESQAQQDGGDVKDVQASTASMLRIRAKAATDESHCGRHSSFSVPASSDRHGCHGSFLT